MKIGRLLFPTVMGYFFSACGSFAQSDVAPEVAKEATFLDDPRIIAALVAAAVTLVVNVIGKLVLDRKLEAFKANLKEKSAQNEAKFQYELEAKKHLYHAVGHLRFQLLLAARDVAQHVILFGEDGRQYPTTVKNYYGQSTLYRFVRPIALCEMIERQISFADFSVDPESIELLQLKRSIYTCFSSGDPILQHPKANWQKQEQHIFYHSLSRISDAIVKEEADGMRSLMPFHEFEDFVVGDGNSSKMSPLPELLEDFSLEQKPLLWLRFILFGFLCSEIVNKKGVSMGFEPIEFPLDALISKVNDKFIQERREEVMHKFRSIRDAGI